MRTTGLSEVASGCKTDRRWSQQQAAVLREIVAWAKSDRRRRPFFLAGYGGTGKTEVATGVADYLPGLAIRYCSFTGKAASLLRQRGAIDATTAHSLVYGTPLVQQDRQGRERLFWQPRDGGVYGDIIIADECSMIGQQLGRDLLATGIKVLVTGDLMQLPPVDDIAYFTTPDTMLTEIHRQAAGSPPLLRATVVRKGGVLSTRRFDLDRMLQADIVLCAMNRTRRQLNKLIRRSHGIGDKLPVVGERIVCLKNNYDNGMLNGTLWTIEALEYRVVQGIFILQIVDDIGNRTQVVAHEDGFFINIKNPRDPLYHHLDLFDFGYCLTCHKSQGSEWDNVVVIDEIGTPGFTYTKPGGLTLAEYAQRWMYTAVTRAKHLVTLMEAP